MARININLVEQRRKEMNLKQCELASILNITRGHYSLIKSGLRSFTLKHIEILWRELDIPLHNLIIKRIKR